MKNPLHMVEVQDGNSTQRLYFANEADAMAYAEAASKSIARSIQVYRGCFVGDGNTHLLAELEGNRDAVKEAYGTYKAAWNLAVAAGRFGRE